MGKDRAKKAVRKLFNGRTAEEVHRTTALKGKTCDACKAPAAIRCRFLAPVDEMLKREARFMINLAQEHGGQVPVVMTKYGKFVRISDAYACDQCRKALEKEAAKAPSWVIVDFDFGPGPDKPVFQVGGPTR